MDPIDQLLGNLDAPDKPASPPSSAPLPVASPIAAKSALPLSAQSIDDLLGQLGEETKQTVQAQLLQGLRSPNSSSNLPANPSPDPQRDQSPAPKLPEFLHPRPLSPGLSSWQPDPLSKPDPFSKPDPSLEKARSAYEEQQRAAELKRQQELQVAEQLRQQEAWEKERRLETLRQQRRTELAKQAKTWLKKLNPRSTEGQWFEEFACNYESREEAAIDYLEALQEAHRIGSGTHS